MTLKENAIYQLPNGRELVASVCKENKPVLRNLSASHEGEYEVDEQGRLVVNGRLTAWGHQDLLDTGRIATPDLVKVSREDTTRTFDPQYEQNLNNEAGSVLAYEELQPDR